jgi:hypothetical protein
MGDCSERLCYTPFILPCIRFAMAHHAWKMSRFGHAISACDRTQSAIDSDAPQLHTKLMFSVQA